MYMDIHSHTYYSKCGRDDPHAVIDAAIAGGIEATIITEYWIAKESIKKWWTRLKKSMRAE